MSLLQQLIETKNAECVLEKAEILNSMAVTYLKTSDSMLTELDIQGIKDLIEISNLLYNNTASNILLLNDGVYDLLLEKYKKLDPHWQVGALPIEIDVPEKYLEMSSKSKLLNIMKCLNPDKINNFMFREEIFQQDRGPYSNNFEIMESIGGYLSKRVHNIKHNYPKLVGTLDKAKFVMCSEAEEKGVINDSNVYIFERDFLYKNMGPNTYNMDTILEADLTFKEDGVSIEADVTTMITGARGRGDAIKDIAADFTPIFYGYKFPNAPREWWNMEPFGMKFEAIMTWQNLYRFNKLTGNSYKNCRTAIIGLLGRSDAVKYRDLITLVPLETSLDIGRKEELELMNRYYTNGVPLVYTIIQGDFKSLLYQVNKFVKEAEYVRDIMGYMYDGVVFTFTDPRLRQALGRVNAVNKYSTAIKFTPLKVLTVFRGWDYTIGEYGTITPMMKYDPVEFYGAIHDHSSGHSYDRFKNLELRIGDILEIEYVGDVMPYAKKADIEANRNNPNQIVPFITHCPCCRTELKLTETGKNYYCPNVHCPERTTKRLVNMIAKLGIKDFGDSRIEIIGNFNIASFSELLSLPDMVNQDAEIKMELVKVLGPTILEKLLSSIDILRTKPVNDYDVLGSLGMESIGRRKWKVILNKYTLQELCTMSYEEAKRAICGIKGAGMSTALTILEGLEFFAQDIQTILNMKNLVITKGQGESKKIRFSGFRDKNLVVELKDRGYDIDDNSSVTKNTDILLVPDEGHESTKTKKAFDYNASGSNILIVPIDSFRANMEEYLK